MAVRKLSFLWPIFVLLSFSPFLSVAEEAPISINFWPFFQYTSDPIEGVKEIIYGDIAFASKVTGNFLLPPGTHGQKPVTLRLQMKKGIAASPAIKKEAEEVISKHYGDLLRTELVEFEGMTLDFERKLPYLGSL